MGRPGVTVKYAGTDFTVGRFGTWAVTGAEAVGGGYQVAMHNGSLDQYTVWNLDNTGNFTVSITRLGR